MKNACTMKVETSKHQVSKVLLSQVKRQIKDLMYYKDAALIERSIAANLCRSSYHKDGSIRSWGAEGIFNFVFEFGRRGGVRISYCNSNGLQSAVFQHDEWDNLKHMLRSMVEKAISDIEDAEAEKKRKEEQERFEATVAEAVRKELQMQKHQELHRDVISASHARKAAPDDGIIYME